MSLSLESVERHVEARLPEEEALSAIEHVRTMLQNALDALDSEDDEKLSLAYERAAECAGHIGRALWFLHRMAKSPESASASSPNSRSSS